jgi:hypothetical protein
MSIKAAVSALALSSAMLMAPAFAQDAAAPSWTIAGNPVAEADQAGVQARCDELAVAPADETSLTQDPAGDTSSEDTTGDGNADSDTGTSSNNSPPAEGLDNAVTTLDLTTITLEDCQTGGWVAAQ